LTNASLEGLLAAERLIIAPFCSVAAGVGREDILVGRDLVYFDRSSDLVSPGIEDGSSQECFAVFDSN
jgi:hypothetical protein